LPLVAVPVSAQSLPELTARAIDGEWLPQPGSVIDWLAAAQERSGPVRQALQALAIDANEVQKAGQGHASIADMTCDAVPLQMPTPQQPKAPDPR
jgi:hypothetical protein